MPNWVLDCLSKVFSCVKTAQLLSDDRTFWFGVLQFLGVIAPACRTGQVILGLVALVTRRERRLVQSQFSLGLGR
jgi:hypothetical protein